MPTKRCIRDLDHEAQGAKRPSAEWSKSPYTPIGQHLTIIYPKRLANPIIFLPIGDNPGPLGNVRRAVSVQTLCQRTSINRHAHSARHLRLRDLDSRAKHSEYVFGS